MVESLLLWELEPEPVKKIPGPGKKRIVCNTGSRYRWCHVGILRDILIKRLVKECTFQPLSQAVLWSQSLPESDF